MKNYLIELIEKLFKYHSLELNEYEFLIENRNHEAAKLLKKYANDLKREFYGNKIFIRGLIEFSNFCKNDCLYCGLRKSNLNCERYRLNKNEILKCADEGYKLGFRTFVLQSGEDNYFTDEILCEIVSAIKLNYSDCAVTLSIGERSFKSYKILREAGADRYLLRHETADKNHYEKLHPAEMSFNNRLECLRNLRKLNYQVGCGFMVGSPFQNNKNLAQDLKFIEEFKPEMCGIGPFIPHKDTPFKSFMAGTVELTCYLLSIIRIIHPKILLPATTALGTVDPVGREKGILSGANVVMPNLSPVNVRKKYELYNNKICTGDESAQCIKCLSGRMQNIGHEIITDRGDFKK